MAGKEEKQGLNFDLAKLNLMTKFDKSPKVGINRIDRSSTADH
jgi:hypothetical protein